jgi:hypothetical protein
MWTAYLSKHVCLKFQFPAQGTEEVWVLCSPGIAGTVLEIPYGLLPLKEHCVRKAQTTKVASTHKILLKAGIACSKRTPYTT